MVLDTSLLQTHRYKIHIEGKSVQSKEKESCPPLHLSVITKEKGAFRSPYNKINNFTWIFYLIA